MAVAASSHHRSPGSITWKSQEGATKQTLIRRCVTVLAERKVVKGADAEVMGADVEFVLLSIGGLEVCKVLASGW